VGSSDDDADDGELTPEDRERLLFVSEAAARALARWNAETGPLIANALRPLAQAVAAQQEAMRSVDWSGLVSAVQQVNSQVQAAFTPELMQVFTAWAQAASSQVPRGPATVSVAKDLSLRWQVEATIEDVEELAASEPSASYDVLLLVILVLALIVQAAGMVATDDPGAKLMGLSSYMLIAAMIQQNRPR
jgi:hypothetical protein